MTGRLRGDAVYLEELDPIRDRLAGIDRVEMIACGTAYYASLVGEALFQDWLGVPARSTVASEFRYSPPPLDARTLVIAVTQSGETADTIAAARLAGDRGAVVIAVTNTVGSAITRESHASVFLQAGPEVAVAATKTFVTQVATVVMLAADIAHLQGRLTPDAEHDLVAALRALPAQAGRAIELSAGSAEVASRYADAAGFMYIGRSFGYPAALEGALKIKEISYLHAEGYAAGELKHGPISLLDAEVPLVAIATRSSVYEKLINNLMEGKARDARVLAVATEGDDQIGRLASDVLWVPDTIEPLSTILAVIPLQLFAYHVAVKRGRDVDQPRNLAKSVTVE
jgi:glucosamine--fructose-6-phosphate aminotransferase (isomerizing)